MVEDVKILVADADPTVRSIVRIATEEEGWSCVEAPDGIVALKLCRRNTFRLAVLDFDLPELDGRLVCRQIRKSSTAPVIFVGRHTGEAERLSCFSAGGNDYVIKPFYPRELIARAKSLMSLHGRLPEEPRTVTRGGITVDLTSRSVRVDGHEVALTPKEYDLLLFLCQNPSKAYTRDALLNLVWGDDFFGSDRTVDTHVKSLRGKIRPYHYYIVTIWGTGYKFEL